MRDGHRRLRNRALPVLFVRCNQILLLFLATIFAALLSRAALAQTPFCASILSYGGDNTGASPNDTALGNLLGNVSVYSTSQKCVSFPPGTYLFSGPQTINMSGNGASTTLVGAGAETTRLYWPSGNGIVFGFGSQQQSVHVRDMSITTGASSSAVAIQLIQNAPFAVNIDQSDITGVTFRGSDAPIANFNWGTGVAVRSVINFTNTVFYGNASTGAGVGIDLGVRGTQPGVGYNIVGSQFGYLGVGVQYNSYIQGVTVTASNFGGGYIGIQVPAAATNVDQLAVTNSQFGMRCCDGIGILSSAAVANTLITGNLFTMSGNAAGAGHRGVYLDNSDFFTISGNSFQAIDSSPNNIGIIINRASGVGVGLGTITGNIFYGFSGNGIPVLLQPQSQNVNVQANGYALNANSVINQAGAANSVGVATQ